jgi:hypothetical protein
MRSSPEATDEIGSRFRLLDLPLELRIRIYSLAFTEKAEMTTHIRGHIYRKNEDFLVDEASRTRYRDLKCFSLEALTQVSEQLRAEALPVLLAESVFVVSLESNFQSRSQARHGKELTYRYFTDIKCTGVLGMKRDLKRKLHSLKPAAVFRDVTFNVRQTGVRGKTLNSLQNVVVFVRVRFLGQNGVDVSSELGHDLAHAIPYDPRDECPTEMADIDATVQGVRDAAKRMGRRAQFNGFMIRDLEQLAKVFRFVAVPPTPMPKEAT